MIKKVNLLMIVVGLLLVSPLALAKQPCDGDPPHPSCKDPLQLYYLVAIYDEATPHEPIVLYTSELFNPTGVDLNCLAQAHSHMKNFNGHFERGTDDCALIYNGNDDFIRNVSFHVTRDKKTGAITSLWFEGQARDEDDKPFVYISQDIYELTAPLVNPNPPVTDDPFILHLHVDNVELYKCDKARLIGNTVCDKEIPVGTFAVEDMLYEPNPEAE